jgi:hypothetical protein
MLVPLCVYVITLLMYCTTSCASSSPEGCDDDDSDLELELQQLQHGTVSTSNSGGVLAAANRGSGTRYKIYILLMYTRIRYRICLVVLTSIELAPGQ